METLLPPVLLFVMSYVFIIYARSLFIICTVFFFAIFLFYSPRCFSLRNVYPIHFLVMLLYFLFFPSVFSNVLSFFFNLLEPISSHLQSSKRIFRVSTATRRFSKLITCFRALNS